jgi:hypothetical protein
MRDFDGTRGHFRRVDRNDGVSAIDRRCAVVVPAVGALVVGSADRGRICVRNLLSEVLVRVPDVDPLTVFGASRMLNQKHVAAARSLQKQRQHAREDASAPNH